MPLPLLAALVPHVPASEDVRVKLDAADEAHAMLARHDASAFASYVLRDEETGAPILQSPIHNEWHALADQHKRLLIWAHVEAGKTTQLSIARVLWELGRNHNLRICVCSNTHGQAAKVCLTLAKYIENSPELHRVFPTLAPARNMPWTMGAFYVQRETRAKDPSVMTCGLHGNILGTRIDLLILDDILDYEISVSARQRKDLYDWYHSTLEGRLTRNARAICIGTAWHRDDLMHQFAKVPAWKSRRYPVLDAEGQPTWPARWPMHRILEKKETLGNALEFSRQLLCIARSDEDSRFKRAWVDAALKRGDGKDMTYALTQVPPGFATFTGVDLGVRTTSNADLTAMFTIVVHPNGDREVLSCEAGRWAGPEIVSRIIDIHQRYGSIVIVENVAAQEFILQFVRKLSAVPVKPFTTTGTAIRHPQFGLESLATEMANGKWIIPSKNGKAHPELEAWIGEMLYYDPLGHPGDRLMASWFAREGARMSLRSRAGRAKLDLLTR